MTINSETPPSTEATSSATLPTPSELLRVLLDEAKPKEELWQVQAAKAVSMLAVGFLNEPQDVPALRAVALLSLAQSIGVKEARKRSIKLARWAEAAPPPLTALAVKDEQQAALIALAKLTTAWSRPYAEQALADLSLPDELVPDLLKWARTTFADNFSFTRDFYAPQVAAGESAERIAFLLKDASKLLKPLKPSSAAELAIGCATLIEAFCASLEPKAADDKVVGGSIAALLHLVQDQAAAMPAVLLQPALVMAVGRLAAATSKFSTSKQVAVVCDALSLATISLLMAELERAGGQAANHWRPMMATWRAAYRRWDQSIADATSVAPSMAALAAEAETDEQARPSAYASEAVFARLLPAWDAFVAELPDANRASSLSAMLRQAAKTVGVVPMGEKDEVISYDPLSHELAAAEGDNPRRVRIVRPGVQVIRADGSARVLVAALVVAA